MLTVFRNQRWRQPPYLKIYRLWALFDVIDVLKIGSVKFPQNTVRIRQIIMKNSSFSEKAARGRCAMAQYPNLIVIG